MRREATSPKKELVADREIAALAASQHGLVTTAQLMLVLPSASQVGVRIAAGHLHRLHRGVYAVGHTAPSAERTYLAAVLACGRDAALSHFAAADLLRLWPNTRRPIDITVPDRGGRSKRPGLRVHRSRSLDAARTTMYRGIPVTSVRRTLQDVRALLPRSAWLRAAHEARVRHGVDVELSEPMTLSRNERRLTAICRNHGLPPPETNVIVQGARREHRVDALWRGAQLVVEVDGYEVHASLHAFERDRDSTADLEDAGLRVLRIAEGQLADAALVASRIADRLGDEFLLRRSRNSTRYQR